MTRMKPSISRQSKEKHWRRSTPKRNLGHGDKDSGAGTQAKSIRRTDGGVAAMKAHRVGKITLRSYKVEPRALPEVKPKMIRQVRARLHCSRSVFARKLFTNERTLEKWEQGRAKPNAQAAALLL